MGCHCRMWRSKPDMPQSDDHNRLPIRHIKGLMQLAIMFQDEHYIDFWFTTQYFQSI